MVNGMNKFSVSCRQKGYNEFVTAHSMAAPKIFLEDFKEYNGE